MLQLEPEIFVDFSMYSILVFGALVVAAKGAHFSSRIVNGQDASIREFPYQVSVQLYDSPWCGGSILNSRHILTAAHCNDEKHPPEAFKVRAGSTRHDSGGQLIDVVEIREHPDFVLKTYDYDVSIYVLAEDLVFNENVTTVTLADVNPDPDTNCTVSGWGYLVEDGGEFPDVLQKLDLPIISRSDCKKMYKHFTRRMLCAGYREGVRDSCQGDSGGPLMCDGVQAGIVSFGTGCARKDKPGVYASVAVLREFIEENCVTL